MPTRRDWYLNALREKYLTQLSKRKEVAANTVTEYRRLIKIATEALELAELASSPTKIGEEEIDFIRHELYSNLSPYQNRKQISIIGGYLKFHGNNIVDKLMIPWPPNSRPNAKWLTDEEAVRMIDAAQGLQRMLLHLELRLLLRRVEVKRMTIKDVEIGMLHVRGKGRLGGKWRTIAWAPETLEILESYTRWREELIAKALEVEPDQQVPESIMIYAQYGWKLGAYQDSALDSMVKDIAAQANIPLEDVSNHVLRRQGTRIYLHAGVDVKEVSAALGHNDIKTTLLYAGMNVEDLAKSQPKVTSYLEELRIKMAQEPYRAMPVYRPQLIAR